MDTTITTTTPETQEVVAIPLALWGERSEVRELAYRIKIMLPYGNILTNEEALALAQASFLTRLNPLDGEIYFLKNEKTMESKGVYIGIKGRRRKARNQLYRQSGKGANYWIEYKTLDAQAKTESGYDPNATVIIATLRDTATIRQYVEIVSTLVAAKMSADDIKAIAGERPVVIGVGIVRNGENLKRPIREVAQKRAERSALAQRFDIALSSDDPNVNDDDLDENAEYTDVLLAETDHPTVSLPAARARMGRDDTGLA